MEHVWQPEVKLHRIDQCVCEEDLTEQPFFKQERISGLKQEDSGPPRVREEQEEVFYSSRNEHSLSHQEVDEVNSDPIWEVLLLLMDGGNSTLDEDRPDTTIPTPQENVCEEEEGDTEQQLRNQLNNQERISSVKQEDPEPPEVKREQEEVFSSPEGGNTSDPVYEVLPLLVDDGNRKPDKDLQDLTITTPPESSPEPPTFNFCGKSDAYKLQLITQLENYKDKQPFQQTERLFNQGQLTHLERSSTVIRQDYHCPERSTGKSFQPFQCKICGERFTKVKDIRAHPRIHRKPLSCTYCGKEFFKRTIFNTHQRIHTGEKPFSCSTCGKTYSRKDNLEIHRRTHTGEKPFSCSTCGKAFAAQSGLTLHVRTHTGEKPYSCKICGRKFTQQGSLQIHGRTHTGERPFSCSTCGKTYSQLHNLKAHMRTHASNGL